MSIPYYGYSGVTGSTTYGYSGVSGSTAYAFTCTGYTSGVVVSYASEVRYEILTDPRFYNLVFGVLKDDGSIDDGIKVSGNPTRILGTVVKTVEHYLEVNPDRLIRFTGSDRKRTELYNKIISHRFNEISKNYNIYGRRSNDVWEDFVPGIIYKELVIQKKYDT